MNYSEKDFTMQSPEKNLEVGTDYQNNEPTLHDYNIKSIQTDKNNEGRKETDYDSFDTFLFYSFYLIKKWMFIFPLYFDFLDYNRIIYIYQTSRTTIMSKDFGVSKRIILFILMIPVAIILFIYLIILLLVVLLLALVAYISLILFIDLPFFITVGVQAVLLYLLISFPVEVTKQELSNDMLVSALWWIQLIWLILFAFVMLQEIDDAMNSVIYITTYYNNKKLKSRNLFLFYSGFSCLPQLVQLIVTYVCASYATELIFNNNDYLTPFLHFSGLFVILKIDSFIMAVLRGSFLYMPPVNAFFEIEAIEEERRKNNSFIEIETYRDKTSHSKEEKDEKTLNNKEFHKFENENEKEFEFDEDDEKNKQKNEKEINLNQNDDRENNKKNIEAENKEKELLLMKKYSWDRIHFPSRHILNFFEFKMQTEASHFFFHNLKPTDKDLKFLVQLKYFLMGLGIFILFAHMLKQSLELACNCTYY